MQDMSHALHEMKDLYKQVLGQPAPELKPDAYAAFPPGIDPLELAVHEVEQLKHYTQSMASAPRPVTWIPKADTFLAEDAFVVRLEIPGVRREDLEVFVAGGEFVVRGQRAVPDKSELQPLHFERAQGPFERRFLLPAGCFPDRVKARCVDGVLEVRIGMERNPNPVEKKVEVA